MNGKASKEELVDAGRRKLEAWKARQARGKLATQQTPLTSTQKSPPVESVPAASNGHRIVEAGLEGSQRNDAELNRRAKALPEARDTSTSSGADAAEQGGSGKASYLPKPPPPRPVFMRPPPFQPRQAIAPPSDLFPARDESPTTETIRASTTPSAGMPDIQIPDPAIQIPDPANQQQSIAGSHSSIDDDDKQHPLVSLGGYSDLSDSYLSLGKVEEEGRSFRDSKQLDDASPSERESPGLSTLSGLDQKQIDLPPKSPVKEQEADSSPPKTSSWSFPWRRRPDPATDPSKDHPSSKDHFSAFHPPQQTAGLPAGQDPVPGQEDARQQEAEGDDVAKQKSKHFRVASLNTWADSLDDLPENTQSPEQDHPFISHLERPRNQHAGLPPANGFHFERLPEITTTSHDDVWPAKVQSPRKAEQESPAVKEPLQKIAMPRGPSFAHLMQEDSQDAPDQFQALQDHIDELTREKFELRRGLEQQQGIAAALASENQRLLDDYNQQGARLHRLETEVDSRQTQMFEQQRVLDSLGGEREAGRMTLSEASQRAENLAAEVVSLEEKAYKSRVAEVRATKKAEESEADAAEAWKAKQKLASECIELKTIIANLQDEKMQLQEDLRQRSLHPSAVPSGDSPEDSFQVQQFPQGASDPGSASKEQGVARIIATASQFSQALPSLPEDGTAKLPEHLTRLLPRREYKGGMSGEAAERAEEQKRIAGNIHDLLQKLHDEKKALLVFLQSLQEQCQQLKAENAQLKQSSSGSSPSPKKGTSPAKRSAFAWLSGR